MSDRPSYGRRLAHFYFAPLRLLAALIRVFVGNRERFARLTARQWAAATLKVASVVTLVAWLLIWSFASEADRTRLSEAARSYWQAVSGSTSH